MGVQIGAQQHAVNAYRSAVHRFNELAYTISITPPYWIKVIWYLFGNGRETDRVVRELKELSNKVWCPQYLKFAKILSKKQFFFEPALLSYKNS